MSDETKRPEEDEVEAHGPKPLGPKPGEHSRIEDEEPDVEAHGPKPLGPKPLGPKPI
jgi:hypothetical protein